MRRSRRITEFTTSRIGRTTRRSCTRLFRNSNERRCTATSGRLSSKSRSSSVSISSSSVCTALKWPSTTKSSSPCSRNETPCLARSGEESQRATTPSMSNWSDLRTVTTALWVTNTATSKVSSSPVTVSSVTAYAVTNRWLSYRSARSRLEVVRVAMRSSPGATPKSRSAGGTWERRPVSELSYLEAIVVGAFQGVTELFPVSSLGHSILVPALVGGSWARDLSVSAPESPYLAFIVGLHVATAAALLVFFWRDWVRIVTGFLSSLRHRRIHSPGERLAWLLIVGTIPVGISGLLLEH